MNPIHNRKKYAKRRVKLYNPVFPLPEKPQNILPLSPYPLWATESRALCGGERPECALRRVHVGRERGRQRQAVARQGIAIPPSHAACKERGPRDENGNFPCPLYQWFRTVPGVPFEPSIFVQYGVLVWYNIPAMKAERNWNNGENCL